VTSDPDQAFATARAMVNAVLGPYNRSMRPGLIALVAALRAGAPPEAVFRAFQASIQGKGIPTGGDE
jgi:hypothetical protein